MSVNTYTNTLGNAMISAKIGLTLMDDLVPDLDILQFSQPVEHATGLDTDVMRVRYYQELFDADTAGNAPDPLVSNRTGAKQDGSSGTGLVANDAYVERQLGMYGSHLVLSKASMKMTSDNLMKTFGQKLANKCSSDIGKLAFRTFDGLDGTSFVRFANDVANEAAVIAEIAASDIKAAFALFEDYRVRPFTSIQSVKNNFNLAGIMPSFVLIVHPAVAIDVQENLTATTQFIHVSQYASKGIEMISKREIGILPQWDCRVIKSDYIKAQTGVATNATASMRQSGGVNITYHNILLGAESFAMPGLGKVVNASVKLDDGTQKRMVKLQGVDFWKVDPSHGPADWQALTGGLGYQFWCGDTSGREGGILLPNKNAAGTTVYKAHKIITTASDPF